MKVSTNNKLKQIANHYNSIDLPVKGKILNKQINDCLLSPNQYTHNREINRVVYGSLFNKLNMNDAILKYGATLTLRVLKISIINKLTEQ